MPDKKISELDSATTNELSDPTAVVPVAVPDDSSGVLTTKKASVSELGSTTLDGLTDVDTTGVTSGQVLKYNGAQWAPGTDDTGGGGSSFNPGIEIDSGGYGYIELGGLSGAYIDLKSPGADDFDARIIKHKDSSLKIFGGPEGMHLTTGNPEKTNITLLSAGDVLMDNDLNINGSYQVQGTNIMNVGENPPSNPQDGTLWYDTSAAAGYVYVDSLAGWIQFNAAGGGGSNGPRAYVTFDALSQPSLTINNSFNVSSVTSQVLSTSVRYLVTLTNPLTAVVATASSSHANATIVPYGVGASIGNLGSPVWDGGTVGAIAVVTDGAVNGPFVNLVVH